MEAWWLGGWHDILPWKYRRFEPNHHLTFVVMCEPLKTSDRQQNISLPWKNNWFPNVRFPWTVLLVSLLVPTLELKASTKSVKNMVGFKGYLSYAFRGGRHSNLYLSFRKHFIAVAGISNPVTHINSFYEEANLNPCHFFAQLHKTFTVILWQWNTTVDSCKK